MKTILVILCSLLSYTVAAQTISFQIDGTVENTAHAKFAYLSTLSQQSPISSDKLFMVVPVVNGQFKFNGSFNLEGKSFQNANIFLDDRGNITKEELETKFKSLIWVSGRDSHLLRIILENLSLQINSREKTYAAVVTKNGTLTNNFFQWAIAAKKDRKALVDFVRANPNSPISLNALQSILFKDEEKFEPSDSAIILFNGLSSKVRQSLEGIAMKEKLHIE